MGHAEMLLAVAGLNELQTAERTQLLASGDWSSFPPDLRVVMHHARKLSKEPRSIVESDIQALVRHHGPDRAIDWIYHICWCNFMTRFADAFQLPLESTNVFLPPAPPKSVSADETAAKPKSGTVEEQTSDAPQKPAVVTGSIRRGPLETRRLLWRRVNREHVKQRGG